MKSSTVWVIVIIVFIVAYASGTLIGPSTTPAAAGQASAGSQGDPFAPSTAPIPFL